MFALSEAGEYSFSHIHKVQYFNCEEKITDQWNFVNNVA